MENYRRNAPRTNQLLAYHDAQRLVEFIAQACIKLAGIGGAYVFLRTREKKFFELITIHNIKTPFHHATLNPDHPLIRALDTRAGYLNIEMRVC